MQCCLSNDSFSVKDKESHENFVDKPHLYENRNKKNLLRIII